MLRSFWPVTYQASSPATDIVIDGGLGMGNDWPDYVALRTEIGRRVSVRFLPEAASGKLPWGTISTIYESRRNPLVVYAMRNS
jgi:hypothetical protein